QFACPAAGLAPARCVPPGPPPPRRGPASGRPPPRCRGCRRSPGPPCLRALPCPAPVLRSVFLAQEDPPAAGKEPRARRPRTSGVDRGPGGVMKKSDSLTQRGGSSWERTPAAAGFDLRDRRDGPVLPAGAGRPRPGVRRTGVIPDPDHQPPALAGRLGLALLDAVEPVAKLAGDGGARGVRLVAVDLNPAHPRQRERDVGDRGRRGRPEALAGLGSGDPVPGLDAVAPARPPRGL